MAEYLIFEPKAGGPAWTASVNASYAEKWMLELTVGQNGLIAGSITSDPGNDALALFWCYPERMDICDNWGGPNSCVARTGQGPWGTIG